VNRSKLPAAVLCGFFLPFTSQAFVNATPQEKPTANDTLTESGGARPYGLEKRTPWATSNDSRSTW